MRLENFCYEIFSSENVMTKIYCVNYLELKLTLTKIKQITVCGNLTDTYEQFVNAFVADECHCSPSLPLQQAKLADAAWKAANHGKDKVVVSDVLSSSANDGECMSKSFVVPVLKFLSDTKFLSDWCADNEMHTTPVFWHQKKCDLCSDGEGWEGGVTPM